VGEGDVLIPNTLFAQLADRIRTSWRANTVAFARDLWNFIPDRWQHRALKAVSGTAAKEQKIAMQGAASPGKTAVEAIAGWHFLLCQGDGDLEHPQGVALSVSGANLKANLWKELAVWYGRSPLLQQLFEMTSERIFARDHPRTWWIEARSYPKSADPNTAANVLSGLHSPYVLYLIDEAGDIPPSVLRKAKQGLADRPKWGKVIIGGNPTSLEGMLYEAVVREAGEWTVFRISGDPDDPDSSERIDQEWARKEIARYGRDDAWVKAFILGQFPPSSMNALLGPDDVYAAINRGLKEDDYIHSQKRLGIDVARFGDDRTVIFPRQGLRAFLPKVLRHNRSHEIAAAVAHGKYKWGSEAEFIDDAGGWGAGTIDACLLGGIALIPINTGSTKTLNPRYFNMRAELNFAAAAWIKRGGSLPQGIDSGIVREATAPLYWFENGKFRIEEKEQIKVKLQGRSPDLWDALCLTFAMAEMPAQVEELLGGRSMQAAHASRQVLHEYDPFDPSRWQ
jgi:hypothetical protein